MDSFLLVYTNGQISVAACIDDALKVLKYEGETSQRFQKERFWKWFKEKIEYQNEPLSFIVITDQESFAVPEDITIAQKSGFSFECLQKIGQKRQFNAYHIFYFPVIEKIPPIEKGPQKRQKRVSKPKKIVENLMKPTVADAYKKETRKYRNGEG